VVSPKRVPGKEPPPAADGKPTEDQPSEHKPGKEKKSGGRHMLRTLGLGLITGAADDDPSAIGTYASAGAAIGPAFLWTAPVTFPMMCAVV
jgi:Mn2+/Fe2+ NRAMP family transporter